MRVILLENIKNLGKKYEIKKVAHGFARNFLFPKKLAKLATNGNLMWLKKQKEEIAQKAEEELKEIQKIVSNVDGIELTIPVKISKDDGIFGSINALKISEMLKEQGFDIRKGQIQLEEPIKEIGEWPVKISFPHGLEAEIMVIVTEEK